MNDQEIKQIRSKYFDQFIKPHLGEKPVVIFQDVDHSAMSNPLRVLTAKLAENNKDFNVLFPKDLEGHDACEEYARDIGYKGDRGKIAYIFVNDKIILIDNHDNCYWRHGAIFRLTQWINPLAVDACIKTQYSARCYEGVPFPVFPFIYPSINDYREIQSRYPVYYDAKYHEQFLECVKNNKFKYSIFMRWVCFPRRRKFTDVCKSIPDSDVACENFMKVEEYMDHISQSKFSIAARGNGKWSHRELEICSMGVPLFSEDREQKMWEPFLPDTHYTLL